MRKRRCRSVRVVRCVCRTTRLPKCDLYIYSDLVDELFVASGYSCHGDINLVIETNYYLLIHSPTPFD